jgi:acyl-CoA-binding protein
MIRIAARYLKMRLSARAALTGRSADYAVVIERNGQSERPMTTLKARFESAVAESKTLPERPDNMTLLRIYALYKQATEGDATGERPGMTDFKGRAKFDAWSMLKGMTTDAAMQAYVDLIEELK